MNRETSDQSRLDELMISGHGLVFDPRTGEQFQLNASGFECLQRLRDGLPAELLADSLSERFGIDPVSARCDADSFLADLQQLEWL